MDTDFIFQNIWQEGTCYGCGPSNPHGLQLKSRWSEDGAFAIARYEPDPKYNAGMEDVMYGGTVASLIDCHSIWTAIAFTYRHEQKEMTSPIEIACVTGQLNITYHKPTPLSRPIYLKAWVDGDIGKKTRVLCELGPQGRITATGDVIAVRL